MINYIVGYIAIGFVIMFFANIALSIMQSINKDYGFNTEGDRCGFVIGLCGIGWPIGLLFLFGSLMYELSKIIGDVLSRKVLKILDILKKM